MAVAVTPPKMKSAVLMSVYMPEVLHPGHARVYPLYHFRYSRP